MKGKTSEALTGLKEAFADGKTFVNRANNNIKQIILPQGLKGFKANMPKENGNVNSDEFDFRNIKIKTNELGETLATRKELKMYKKEWGKEGIKVTIDKYGKKLPSNVDGGFNFHKGEIILPKNPTKVSVHHEGFHAEQWLDIGKDSYMQLSPLQREEYVFEQIMKNQHLFDDASIIHSQNYIDRLRLKFN